MDNSSEEDQTKSVGRGKLLLVGALGSILGAAAALLLAPWRGAEARKKLKEGAAKAGAAAKEKATVIFRRAKGEEQEEEQ